MERNVGVPTVGLKHNTVSDKIKQISQFLEEMSENPISEIPTKYEFLADKWKEISEFQPIMSDLTFLIKSENLAAIRKYLKNTFCSGAEQKVSTSRRNKEVFEKLFRR